MCISTCIYIYRFIPLFFESLKIEDIREGAIQCICAIIHRGLPPRDKILLVYIHINVCVYV